MERAFKCVSIHQKLCIGFLLVGILLCGLSLLVSNQFLISDHIIRCFLEQDIGT